jgi:hypothetical protein
MAATRKNPPPAAPAMSASGRKSVSSAARAPHAARAARQLEVDEGDRHERGHQQQAEHDAHGVVLACHHRDVEGAGEELDDRVARGDRRAAVVAAAAQGEPRQHWDVVDRAQLSAALRAARARAHERLPARQTMRNDVQERADEQPTGGREDDGQDHGGREGNGGSG